jgi:tetratricopeptide (TPR) repeat protein
MLAEAAIILVRIAGIRGDAHMEEVVATLSNLAVVLCRQDRYDEARRRMTQAHRLIQEAASDNLTLIPLYVHTVARYAEILLEVGDLDEACRLSEWAYQRSEPGFLRDGTGRPETPAYAALVRANVLFEVRLSEHALTVIDDAIHRYQRLASSLDSAFRYDLALALNRKLDIEGALGDHEAAVAAGTEAIAMWERLIADGATDFEVNLAETLAMVAQDQLALHRPSEAIVAATRSRRITAGRTDRISLSAGATACLVETRAFKDTDSTLAIAAGREAVRLFADLTAEKPLDYGAFLAEAWTDLGFAYSTAGRRPAALQASTRAVQAIEAFIQRGGDNAERVHAKCLRNLSCDLLDAGYPAEAASASRHSIQLRKSRPDLTETDILEIRDSLTNLENQCLAMNDYRGAVAARGEVQQIDRLHSLT